MNNNEMGDVCAHESDAERKLLMERWKLNNDEFQQINISICRINDMEKRAHCLWSADSMSGASASGDH